MMGICADYDSGTGYIRTVLTYDVKREKTWRMLDQDSGTFLRKTPAFYAELFWLYILVTDLIKDSTSAFVSAIKPAIIHSGNSIQLVWRL